MGARMPSGRVMIESEDFLKRFASQIVAFCIVGLQMLGVVRDLGRRTSEMHRTQDSYESVSCSCRAVCSLEASARALGVGDLEGRSAAKPCRLPAMFCGKGLKARKF